MSYLNRQEAGKLLAKRLDNLKNDDTVILALPRGGIILAAEIANHLKAPLGLVLVRKIGHPLNPEYAIGAIAEDADPIYSGFEISQLGEAWLKGAEDSARRLIEHRRKLYYGKDFTPPDITHKTAVLVDDGIATGLTMRAALEAIRQKHPKQIVIAIPVAPSDVIDILERNAERVVILQSPRVFFGAVGSYYQEFEQVDDKEVKKLLRENQYNEVKDDRSKTATRLRRRG